MNKSSPLRRITIQIPLTTMNSAENTAPKLIAQKNFFYEITPKSIENSLDIFLILK